MIKRIVFTFVALIIFSCTSKQVIRPKVDIGEVLRLQQSVNQGHQPWRLDPVMVAGVYLRTLDPEIKDYDCKLENLNENKATVSCDKGKRYLVILETLISHDGIWTVTEVEIRGKQPPDKTGVIANPSS